MICMHGHLHVNCLDTACAFGCEWAAAKCVPRQSRFLFGKCERYWFWEFLLRNFDRGQSVLKGDNWQLDTYQLLGMEPLLICFLDIYSAFFRKKDDELSNKFSSSLSNYITATSSFISHHYFKGSHQPKEKHCMRIARLNRSTNTCFLPNSAY